MIVSCNSCAKRYLIDDAMIGEQGQFVRCASCGHTWTQRPEVYDYKLQDIQSNDVVHKKPKINAFWIFIIILLASTAMTVGTYSWRHYISESWPSVGSTLSKLGIFDEPPIGLMLENTVAMKVRENDTVYMILKGEIVNTTQQVARIPELTILLYGNCNEISTYQRLISKVFYKTSEDRCVINKWYHTMTQSRILPSEKLKFETLPVPVINSALDVVIEF